MIEISEAEINYFQLLQQHILNSYRINIEDFNKQGGYSNFTFKGKATDGTFYIVRISHPNKSELQIRRESYVLNCLKPTGSKLCPELLETTCHQNFSIFSSGEKELILQVFKYIKGDVRYVWFECCEDWELELIFDQLALLHHEMAGIPLEHQESNIQKKDFAQLFEQCFENETIRNYLVRHQQNFINRAEKLWFEYEKIFQSSAHKQFVHGDVHLENLLFTAQNMVAFIDFENAHYDALETDVIFAAFRVCKVGKADDRLYYDLGAIKKALKAYVRRNPKLCEIEAEFARNEKLWKALFCLDQSMLYMDQSARGVWQLTEGIGFLSCFNEVLAYEK